LVNLFENLIISSYSIILPFLICVYNLGSVFYFFALVSINASTETNEWSILEAFIILL